MHFSLNEVVHMPRWAALKERFKYGGLHGLNKPVTFQDLEFATLGAARHLARPRQWCLLGQVGQVIWGQHQGNSYEPYWTCVDLAHGVSRCDCPDRVMHCKHALGLMTLFKKYPATFCKTTPPHWAVLAAASVKGLTLVHGGTQTGLGVEMEVTSPGVGGGRE